ncbi:hypothetical protein [Thalassotalea sp. G2M2-11]|uniref:hypothetical protein n=1 Tax=Thalassotalea sp. G2M2-11 TaxID=2787627 RepID=UPI0019D10A92|nr:hypothetical protein [Thalassotalea sp. G2M2-11]
MNDIDSNLISKNSTAIGVGGLLLGVVFLGTGGSSITTKYNNDRGGYSTPAIVQNDAIIQKFKLQGDDGKALDFQKLSIELMNTFGFSIQQYSEIMQVTRPTIYKWHDLNTPIKKVQSRNLDRLKKLNESLSGIKDTRKRYFSDWLRNPLDKDAALISAMLMENDLDVGGFIEQLPVINVNLHSYQASKELDDLLELS